MRPLLSQAREQIADVAWYAWQLLRLLAFVALGVALVLCLCALVGTFWIGGE